jgi:hypothetical protein
MLNSPGSFEQSEKPLYGLLYPRQLVVFGLWLLVSSSLIHSSLGCFLLYAQCHITVFICDHAILQSLKANIMTSVRRSFVWQGDDPLSNVCTEKVHGSVWLSSYRFSGGYYPFPLHPSSFTLPPSPSVVWHTFNRLPEVMYKQALMLLADWGCLHTRATAKIDCVIPPSPSRRTHI